MARLPFRRSETHLVDELGLVGCARQGRDVALEECLTCAQLREMVSDGDVVTEIRCTAAPHEYDTLVPFGFTRMR
jgi:hypothetical protein